MPPSWPLTARDADLRRLATRHADRSIGGTVLTGPAGVGKTRLAEEALAATRGPTARAVGHPSTRDIPLGALAHLLPPRLGSHANGDDLRAELFHQGRAELGRRAAGGRLTLLVDDVDQLDDTSLGLLLPLTVDRTITLIATLRAGRPLPAAMAALVKDGHLAVDPVAPLERGALVALLRQVVGMPVAGDTVDRLLAVSEGNLQVLVELMRSARAHGEVRTETGEWSITRLPTDGALDELVTTHLAELSDQAVTATEILAVAGWLELEDLRQEVEPGTVEALETGGFIRLRRSGDDTIVELAHPVYGEVVRQRTPLLRTRSIQGRLADRLQARRLRRHDDVTRLALWRIESGGDIDTDVLVQAGRRAIAGRDRRLAHRFATEAAARGATHDAARIAVEAAVLGADVGAVEVAIDAVWGDPSLPDPVRSDLARRLSTIRFATGDLRGALTIIDDARDRVTDTAAVAAMDVQQAQLLASSGRPLDAEALLATVPRLPDIRLEVERASAEAVAWTSIGRFADGLEAARRGAAAQRRLPTWLARRGMAAHLVNEAHALSYAGRFAEAATLVQDALAEAERSGAPAATFWFHLVAGEVERDRGDGHAALHHFTIAADLTRPSGQHSTAVWVLVGVAQAHLLLGHVEEAAQALAEADAAGDSPVATSWSTRERTRAWWHAASGDGDAAAALIAEVVDAVRADGIRVFEAVLLHDLVRLGRAADATDRLDELELLVEGTYVGAMATHARAAVACDVAGLTAAVAAFEETGALLFAAETACELAELLDRRGDERGAAASRRHAAELVARLGGAATPVLRLHPGPSELTRREREVADLAASGLASAEIAARLHLSVRTVDTHLGRVYRKLGVTGRDELSGAI